MINKKPLKSNIIPEDDCWKAAIISLVKDGDITCEQANLCLRRLKDGNNKKEK